MTAKDKDRALSAALCRRTGKLITTSDANTLRRAEMTLHRWAKGECGDSNEYRSWAIERDETTGKPYRVTRYYHATPVRTHRFPIPDREAGALRRVKALCDLLGLYFHHQTDPRGCALYVSAEPMTDSDYSSVGVAVC